MKKQSYLTGIIFIGFGIYFLLQQYHVSLFEDFYTWPTLLFIVGCGFLVNAYMGKEYDSIFPGVLITGLGIHFHVSNHFDIWPNHSGIFLLLISLGLLLRYVKTGSGLFQGILFLSASILLLFFDRIEQLTNLNTSVVTFINNSWPILFIILGGYLFIFPRKKK